MSVFDSVSYQGTIDAAVRMAIKGGTVVVVGVC
jgi:threonine dehydrogenase-like Zn-dependent dehydrogenase